MTVKVSDLSGTRRTEIATIKWAAGTEVTFAGEKFQVLNDVYEGQITCELFARTNLNTAGTAQANAAFATTKCAFSSTNYWLSNWSSTVSLNLNLESGYTATDVMGKVKSYAKAKGAIEGRLITLYEARNMRDSSNIAIKNMLWGKGNPAQSFESYWMAADDLDYNNYVSLVFGEHEYLSRTAYSNTNAFGIRPVLTVFVSQVS